MIFIIPYIFFFLKGGPRFNKSLAGCLEKAKPSPKLGRMGVGRAVEGTKWPVWVGQADSCNYIGERSCPRQWKMKSISVTHGLVHKSKRGSSLSSEKKPQSLACSKKLKYTLSWLLGREANILGGLHTMPGLPSTARATPCHVERQIIRGKNICNRRVWGGIFSQVDGDRSGGVRLEGTLNPKCVMGHVWLKRSLGQLSLYSSWKNAP